MKINFLCGLSGRIVTPCDASYPEDRQDWNHAIQQYPTIINYCQTAEDVSNAVRWSTRNNIPLRIRNGGHNYAGYSNGNGVLVIDVSEMTGIELNEQSHTVRVQGGVTNGQLYNYVGERGYPFPGGTCPTVGVCGYALGGGWGLSCRLFGLGCDSILEIEMVNDEGRIIKANRRQNQDLFWACRGAGGGNFGVVISITFSLPPPVQNVTLITIAYPQATTQAQELFLQTWQEWLRHADKRVTLISRIYNAQVGHLSMVVRGIFYGEPDEAVQLIQSFFQLPGAVPNIQYVTFLQAVTIIGSDYPSFETFQSASRFAYRPFTPDEIHRIVGLVQQRPKGSVFAGLSMYALGGKVAEKSIDDTAFFYRKANYILWLQTMWEEERFAPANSAWVERQFRQLTPLTAGAYVNFPYAKLPCDLHQYYGCHTAALQQIKQKYDPFHVFTFPQGFSSSNHPYLSFG